MSARINFFLKPIQPAYTLDGERFLIELSLGVVCTVLAVFAWSKQMLIVAAPCALIGVTCLGLVVFSLVSLIVSRLKHPDKQG